MSEEKPVFKVTDRRLFNADGTPREVEREEPEPTQASPAAPEKAREENIPASDAPRDAPAPPLERGRGEAVAPAQTPAEAEDDDPQEFLMVVEFVASFAAESLGMSAHPGAGGPPPQVNLPLARQCIDMLGTLERKTRGNLNAEEAHFLDLILSQLRMQYVQLSQARPGGAGGPRGFTGSDITGGR